jgi:fumarate reductase subunit C
MDTDKADWYEKLGSIDRKCGALLQVTAVLLVFVALPAVHEKFLSNNAVVLLLIVLLLSCLGQLYILWFKEDPKGSEVVDYESLVKTRQWVLNTAVAITAVVCLLLTAFAVWTFFGGS